MLATYLNIAPYIKFILIEDTTDIKGCQILDHILKNRIRKSDNVHYFVLEGKFSHVSDRNLSYYDCVSRYQIQRNIISYIKNVLERLNTSCIFIIDSLVHLVIEHGFQETYKLLNGIINNKFVLQLVTILHVDMLEDVNLVKYFEYLSTLSMSLEEKFKSDYPRISYTYKKSGGKVLRQVEEFYFENGILKTQDVKMLDPKVLVKEAVKEISPDSLTTFKISLEDDEKKSRDQLVLPYLPKETGENDEGKIFYQLDEVDDWDEEDPDDDLDI